MVNPKALLGLSEGAFLTLVTVILKEVEEEMADAGRVTIIL